LETCPATRRLRGMMRAVDRVPLARWDRRLGLRPPRATTGGGWVLRSDATLRRRVDSSPSGRLVHRLLLLLGGSPMEVADSAHQVVGQSVEVRN
jgi:hypothetical protein